MDWYTVSGVGFLLIVAVILIIAVWRGQPEDTREEELAELAEHLELSFNPNRNANLSLEYSFVEELEPGAYRYACNVISGNYCGHAVLAFDCHFRHARKKPRHRCCSVMILKLPRALKPVRVMPEGISSKLAQAFGHNDIDFESFEFSRAFCVRSPDKQLAYDICNPRMMEYLLAHRELTFQIHLDTIFFMTEPLPYDFRLWSAAQIESGFQQLVEIRSLLPDYLFTKV